MNAISRQFQGFVSRKGETMKRALLRIFLFGIFLSFFSCQASNDAQTEIPAESKVTPVTVEQLNSQMENKDFFLINVHTPYAGEIPGTDMFVEYNVIDSVFALMPIDKSAKIVLYCRSGHMSANAAKYLSESGYTSIYDVTGGMAAWKEAGYELLDNPLK